MAILKPFQYERPASREQLAEILRQDVAAPCFLAGGTDLLVDMRTGKKAPRLVIDLKGLPGLAGIKVTADNGLQIGALTLIHSLETEPAIAALATALYDGAQNLGSWQVRNRATIGGNLANGAPTADTAAPLLALDAEIVTWGPQGARRIPAASFWLGAGKPNLTAGEIITGIEIPAKPGAASAYIKLGPRKAMDIAVASAAVVLNAEQGIIRDIRIALGGAAATPLNAISAAEFLTGKAASPENVTAAGKLAAKDSNPRSSHRASREYRLNVIPVLVERAITLALQRHEAQTTNGGTI